MTEVTSPGGEVWTVGLSPKMPPSKSHEDAVRFADYATAGAPPLTFHIGAVFVLYCIIQWFRERLLPFVASPSSRWNVTARSRATGATWEWLVLRRRAAKELMEALEGGQLPATVALEGRKLPRSITHDEGSST